MRIYWGVSLQISDDEVGYPFIKDIFLRSSNFITDYNK